MAKQGRLPKYLAKIRIPKCVFCFFGKQGRTPWRWRRNNNKIQVAQKPGECISVDQMESTTPEFFGQAKGKITSRRYRYATVFVDHFSRYTYVHLQSTITSKETVEAKQAFELHMKDMGVKVARYHADNGRFADILFLQDVKEQKQSITFCGVNAHW